jgi:selenocysteine lyase/cysteine desulfurase
MENIEKIREQFPVVRNRVFLNHAASSPFPAPVAEAMLKLTDKTSNFGPSHEDLTDLGKAAFAILVNASIDEVALVENTSVGMNVAANVLHSNHGSKIVTTDLEYPSAVYPFLRKSLGYEVHYVKNIDGKIRLEDIEKAVDDKTTAVAISQVEYANGFRFDLKPISEIAHKHGAYLVVDAIQACGAIPVDVKRDNIDFLATACYKWLLSPPGAGFLYVKKELVERFEPPMAGWASVKQEIFNTTEFWDIWKMPYSETASRFEVGSPSVISFIGAREAIKLLLNTGIENIEKRILKLTDCLIERLTGSGFKLQTPLEPQHRSGIVNFKVNSPKETADKLAKKGIIISPRANGIRVSPHFYNTEEEIDKLIEEVKKDEG